MAPTSTIGEFQSGKGNKNEYAGWNFRMFLPMALAVSIKVFLETFLNST